jgi:hypothetical protein
LQGRETIDFILVLKLMIYKHEAAFVHTTKAAARAAPSLIDAELCIALHDGLCIPGDTHARGCEKTLSKIFFRELRGPLLSNLQA